LIALQSSITMADVPEPEIIAMISIAVRHVGGDFGQRRWVAGRMPPRGLAAVIRARVASGAASGMGMIVGDGNAISGRFGSVSAGRATTWLFAHDGASAYLTAVGEAELRYAAAWAAGYRC